MPILSAVVVHYKALSEALFGAVVLIGAILAVLFRRSVLVALRTFFSEPGSAFNLAVVRIVFYATALALVDVPPRTAEHFAELPRGLMVPPTGFSLVAGHFPISVTLVRAAFWVAVVASVFGAIGLFTRVASIAFLVSATYYLTIPQIFGKVIHYHSVVWVAAVFAVSRTADVLSLDAVIRARRSRQAADVAAPVPSTAYSRPIRLIWLFLGVSYLGPGLWKYRTAGIDWAAASNMRAILYNTWYELGGYRPLLRVDKIGLLLTLGALATLGFELGFFFLLWNRYTRILAATMGLFFHGMTDMTMRIGFYWAMILYVSFVDWERLSRWTFGRREQLVFAFDGGCGLCRVSATALARSSLPGAVNYTTAQDLASNDRLPPGIDLPTLLDDIHVLTPTHSYRGFHAYRRLAWRVPLLWPALPLLFLPPVANFAQRIYRRVTDNRRTHVGNTPVLEATPRQIGRTWTDAPTLVGAIILALMVTAIAANRTNAWPVALYPTFQGLHQPRGNQLIVAVREPGSARRTTISLQSCFSWMPPNRYTGLVTDTVERASAGHDELIRELVRAAAPDCPQLAAKGATFFFYDDEVVTTPDQVGRLVSRKLLLRWPTLA